MKENINILVKNFRYRIFLEEVLENLEKQEKLKDDQISVLIADDLITKKLNKKYRYKNKTTDVLSFAEIDIKNNFSYNKNKYLGEIIINIEQVKRQAKNIKEEIVFMLIHGYLHLRGYDHNNDREEFIMNKKSKSLISKI